MTEIILQKLKSNQKTLTVFTFLMHFVFIGIIFAFGFCIYLMSSLTINLSGIYLYYSYIWMAILIISIFPLFFLLSAFNKWKAQEKNKIFRVSNIMGIAKPENKIMEILKPYQAKKFVNIVKLSEPDKKDSFPEFAIISDSSPGILPFIKTKKNVVIYKDNLSEDKLVAIEDGKKIIIGYLFDKKLLNKIIDDKKKLILKILPPILFITFLFMMSFISFDIIKIYENFYLAEQSDRWEAKDGIIIYSDIKNAKITRGKKQYDGFEAVVIYEYEANNKKYKGNKIYFGYEPSIKHEPAQNILAKYPVGSYVNILYNPEKPELSVLEKSDTAILQKKLSQHITAALVIFITVPLAVVIPLLIVPFAFQQYSKKIIQIIEEEQKK